MALTTLSLVRGKHTFSGMPGNKSEGIQKKDLKAVFGESEPHGNDMLESGCAEFQEMGGK